MLAPPYDVISPAEHLRLLARSPLNVVRIELPSDEDGDKYQGAASTLAAWRSAGVLEQDELPRAPRQERCVPLAEKGCRLLGVAGGR